MSEYIVGRSTFGHDLPIGETYSNYGDSFRFGCEAYGEAKAFGERVTRCRDCSGMVDEMGVYECQRFSGEYHSCDPDGFCAWSEPREDA